jgi:hypothetical protein
MIAALNSIENEEYRVLQRSKQQQPTLIDMWKKKLDFIFNVTQY